MIAFKNTVLFDRETNLWSHPNIGDIYLLYKRKFYKDQNIFYISKRHAEWWYEEEIRKILDHVLRYNVFIINIVRDPRDVLTSKHAYGKKKHYVEPWYWEKSIGAADFLMTELEKYNDKLTIKYEDVVLNAKNIEKIFEKSLGLLLRDDINSWNSLKDNIENSEVNKSMIPYMHKLRNFDKDSIGRWKNNEEKQQYVEHLLSKSEYRDKILAFMKKYGYV
jgi:hypothetical protein